MITGTLGAMSREEAQAHIERLGGKVTELGEQEDDRTWWSGRTRGANSRKRRRWASQTLDEPAFLKLIMWEK